MRFTALMALLVSVSATLAFWDAPKLEQLPTSEKAKKIVLIAGKPEAKPTGEHEYFAGIVLLANMFEQTPAVHPILFEMVGQKMKKFLRMPLRSFFS